MGWLRQLVGRLQESGLKPLLVSHFVMCLKISLCSVGLANCVSFCSCCSSHSMWFPVPGLRAGLRARWKCCGCGDVAAASGKLQKSSTTWRQSMKNLMEFWLQNRRIQCIRVLSLSCSSRVPLLRGVIHKVVCQGVIQMDLNVLFSQHIGTFPFLSATVLPGRQV